MEDLTALRRHWFVVCRSAELGRRPLARALLGEPLVLFRDASGRPAALRDRCPHRNAPLSAGWARGDLLVCPYHGWSFDRGGACRALPGSAGPSDHRARVVPAYPTIEQDGLIWAALEPAAGPPPPQPRQPGEAVASDSFSMAAGLLDGLENFLDATHTHFVHRGVVRGGARRRRVLAVVRGGADFVEAEYLEGRQSGLISRLFGGGVDSSLGRFRPPATAELEYRAAGRTRLLISLHFSPETADRLRVVAVARGASGPLPAWLVVPPLRLLLRLVRRQDQRILALQQANLRRFGGPRYSSTELDLMRPHIERLLRSAGEPVAPFERRAELHL